MQKEYLIKMKIKTIKGFRNISINEPTFIIAEMSGNHNQSIERAKQLIDVAAEAKVDAIKLQTYTADTMTIDCDKEDFIVKVNDAWKNKTLYELYNWAYTPWEWHKELKKYAESKGLIFFSTPFDETAVNFLEELNVPLYKIASFETNHIPLLKKIAKTGKPVIISRGLTSYLELEEAISVLRENGCKDIVVLHCVSSYPAKYEQMNLKTIKDLSDKFNVISGLSDHSLGNLVPIASVAMGAKVIEKHFTLSRKDGGPDAEFSLEKEELIKLVEDIRNLEKALGCISKESEKKESENKIFKRSIYVVKDIKKGEIFTKDNIRVIRPGYGLHPRYYEDILGKKSILDVEKGTSFKEEFYK
jgi:pseudaminic acid synthase